MDADGGRSMMQEQKDSPYKWSTYNEERKHMLLRTKFPRLTITLEDDADEKQVADALKKAAEFLLKVVVKSND